MPGGIYIAAGVVGVPNKLSTFLARPITAPVLSLPMKHKFVAFITKLRKGDQTIMHDLMKTRRVTPVIDKRYRLSEVPEAIRYLAEGHARGKVVITLESDNTT